jgi:hypothetical protein
MAGPRTTGGIMSYDMFIGLLFMLAETVFGLLIMAAGMLALCSIFGSKKG